MKVIAFALVTVVVIAVVVSRFAPPLEYTPGEFKVISEGLTDEGIELVLETPPESIFYCPGVMYEQSNGVIEFSVVRSHIDSKPIVDIPAENRGREGLAFLFPVDFEGLRDGGSIELRDSSGHSYGSWRIP